MKKKKPGLSGPPGMGAVGRAGPSPSTGLSKESDPLNAYGNGVV